MPSSFPIRGEIQEGFARAIHEFLMQVWGTNGYIIQVGDGSPNISIPDWFDVVFDKQRLEAGKNVIAFLGERVSTGKKVKCESPKDGLPYGYERWDTVYKTVYVKCSQYTGNSNDNWREVVRVWDALVFMFDHNPYWFKDKNMRSFQLSAVPVNASTKEHAIAAGSFQCKTEVKFPVVEALDTLRVLP